MNSNGADVVGMRLKGGDLFGRVVVVDSQLEVIGTAHNPVLSCDEATGANRDIGELEGLDDLLRLVRPNVDVSCKATESAVYSGHRQQALGNDGRTAVQSREDPWFVWMEIDAFYPLTAGIQLALQKNSARFVNWAMRSSMI